MLTPEREAEIRELTRPAIRACLAEIDRLRAEVERLTAERDTMFKGEWAALNLRAERAEADAERLAEALRLVWDEWPRLSPRRHGEKVGAALRQHEEKT